MSRSVKIRLFLSPLLSQMFEWGVENPLTIVCRKLYKRFAKHINIVMTRMGIPKKQKRNTRRKYRYDGKDNGEQPRQCHR